MLLFRASCSLFGTEEQAMGQQWQGESWCGQWITRFCQKFLQHSPRMVALLSSDEDMKRDLISPVSINLARRGSVCREAANLVRP